MAKKPRESADEGKASSELASTIKESAQQIWLAGLGAFSKAQEEGGKVFDALVKEGVTIQQRTQATTEGRLSEATDRMAAMATDLSSKASGQWNKLEGIFEERVSRALRKLGVPSAKDVDDLAQRLEDLTRTVASLRRGNGSPRTTARKTAAKQPVAKVARKRTPARKAAG